MEEFLNSLGIRGEFLRMKNGGLVMDIKDSNEFAKIYSILDNSDAVAEDEESSVITYESEMVQFDSPDYIITMIGDLENDSAYKLTIKNAH